MVQETKTENEKITGKEAAGQSAASAVLSDDTKITVESRVPAVYYTCPITFETFSWVEAGDKQEMTYKQIRIMSAKHPRYFNEKWLLPCDAAVIKKLNLEKYYSNKVSRADMKKICNNDVKEVEELLLGLNSEAKTGGVLK